MEPAQEVERIIRPSLADMGFDVVRVRLMGGNRPTLQVMAERVDGGGITVEECAEISRTVSALLDVDDPIKGSYVLEVSSPGIDRPLTRSKDFERFAGFDAKIELDCAVDGRRRFRGTLLGVEDGKVSMECDGTRVAVEIDAIRNAKLVMNDKLLAATTLASAAAVES